MKIGLETCFIDNFGACLQAFALQNSIMENNFDCEIINYSHKDVIYSFLNKRESYFNKILKYVKHPLDIIYRSRMKKFNRKTSLAFNKFRKENLIFTNEKFVSFDELVDKCTYFDGYVCGSDQIWNPLFYKSRNIDAEFLMFAPKNKIKISYAPSIGLSYIPDEYVEKMRRLIKNINYVSVREQKGQELVENVLNHKATTVLDPVFLPGKEFWVSKCGRRLIKEDYILCYFFGESNKINDFIKSVRKIVKKKVIVLPMMKKQMMSNFKKVYECGPLEFVNLINHASLILTDSFHATAFSLILNKPFLVLDRFKSTDSSSMNSRLISILNIAGLNERIVHLSDSFKFNKDFLINIDFSNPNKNIGKEIEKSKNFLKDSLNKI